MSIDKAWHRRQALMLASQLPEGIEDARLVVLAMMELVDTFLAERAQEVIQIHDNILPFVS